MPNLRRKSDGEGYQGTVSRAYTHEQGEAVSDDAGEPITMPTVGYSIRVGSVTAGTYSSRDHWTTTPITKILERIENENFLYIRFQTSNSEYEWWEGEYPKELQ